MTKIAAASLLLIYCLVATALPEAGALNASPTGAKSPSTTVESEPLLMNSSATLPDVNRCSIVEASGLPVMAQSSERSLILNADVDCPLSSQYLLNFNYWAHHMGLYQPEPWEPDPVASMQRYSRFNDVRERYPRGIKIEAEVPLGSVVSGDSYVLMLQLTCCERARIAPTN